MTCFLPIAILWVSSANLLQLLSQDRQPNEGHQNYNRTCRAFQNPQI
jgi:hypothetical protein